MQMHLVKLTLFSLLPVIGAAQNPSRTLAEYWFEDDEWHLQVQYIISADELAAYHQLKTADERDNFISRFWTRRDPTPGTSQNEFRDEYYRRVEYANTHLADPNNLARGGMETDRGRVYVMLGAPNGIEAFQTGAYEIWNYTTAADIGSDFRIQFSVPRVDSCDGSYRILSPPVASFKAGSVSVQVYPGRFVTVRIPVDFSKTASVAQMLRTPNGEPVLENEVPIFELQLGPARNEPLSKHLLNCRMFETSGMGFTHPIPPGSYIFSSIVTFINGDVQKDNVAFDVK
jgi:GWxTD domain-containing protein